MSSLLLSFAMVALFLTIAIPPASAEDGSDLLSGENTSLAMSLFGNNEDGDDEGDDDDGDEEEDGDDDDDDEDD